MNPRLFAWIAGLLLVVIGVAGFVPAVVAVESDALRTMAGVGDPRLFGLLPVSPALNVVHVALGLWGLVAGRNLNSALTFARRTAMVAALLLLGGMIPGLDTVFGAAPLYGNNLLLHGTLALLCALFGWLYRRPIALPQDDPEAEPEF